MRFPMFIHRLVILVRCLPLRMLCRDARVGRSAESADLRAVVWIGLIWSSNCELILGITSVWGLRAVGDGRRGSAILVVDGVDVLALQLADASLLELDAPLQLVDLEGRGLWRVVVCVHLCVVQSVERFAVERALIKTSEFAGLATLVTWAWTWSGGLFCLLLTGIACPGTG